MMPIDLTKAPPRSPREELRGLCMLPRMIDIARAMLPRGSVGQYQIGRGVSGAVFTAFGISTAEFIDLVRDASSDDEVASALWSRRSVPATALNRRLHSLTVADVPEELRADFQRFYGSQYPPDRCVLDILEADDAQSFTGHA
jgi:hypothetical protein